MSPIVVRREVAADPARVFAHWIDPSLVALWWWPHLADTTYHVDAQAGGTYRIWSEAAGIGVHGEYRVVDPGRLEFTWIWDGEDGASEESVVAEFTDDGPQQTLLTVTHVCSADQADDLRRGWEDVLDRLVAVSAG